MKDKPDRTQVGAKSETTLLLLREATNEQTAAKVGIFGDTGSGKTTTGGLLALGLSLTYCQGRPVAMMDTESASDFLLPIFRAEKVNLLTVKSRAFSDMLAVLAEAEQSKCAALVVDSVTHTWTELVESYCRKKGITKPEFQHWKEIKQAWNEWTTRFLSSPLHIIVNGRLGYEYEYQENERGKKELIKGDSKMRAEGQFGYEPHLLIEMEKIRDTAGAHHGGRFLRRAYILKDRSWALNGKTADFPDKDGYESGDWKKIFQVFEPHFEVLNIGGRQQAAPTSTSDGLFGPDGSSEYYRRERQKRIALEEIETTMVLLWPGQDQKSKRIKLLVIEVIFGTRSWEAVQQQNVERIEDALRVLRQTEKSQKDVQLFEEAEVLNLVRECMVSVSGSASET
jgi:AAA domain